MHVVWDWNGTLLDDHHVVIAAMSEGVRPHRHPVSIEEYRDHYTRPVKLFYEALFGRDVTDAEWLDIDRRFHDTYRELMVTVRLAGDAEAALDLVEESEASQSLLSMYPHDDLLPVVRSHGIEHRFTRIDGLRGDAGDLKAAYLVAHLDAVQRSPAETVMIGDTPDDAAAAKAVGAACVLYHGGSHHRGELEAVGFPVVESLVDAVEVALAVR